MNDTPEAATTVTAAQLRRLLDGAHPPLVLDVRNEDEWHFCRIEGSRWIPLPELATRVAELPRDRPIVTLCHLGMRSEQARRILVRAGFDDVRNLTGGIEAWRRDVDPSLPHY